MNQVRLAVRVIPSSSRNDVTGWHGDALKVKVQAPPEKGKANTAVIKVLSTHLGLPGKAITLLRGETSESKVFQLNGMNERELHRVLDRKAKEAGSGNDTPTGSIE